MLLDLNCIHTG